MTIFGGYTPSFGGGVVRTGSSLPRRPDWVDAPLVWGGGEKNRRKKFYWLVLNQ
jgi:hypothetical protein